MASLTSRCRVGGQEEDRWWALKQVSLNKVKINTSSIGVGTYLYKNNGILVNCNVEYKIYTSSKIR